MKIKRILVPIMAAAMIFTSLVIVLAGSVHARDEAIPPTIVSKWPVPNTFTVPRTTTVSVQYDQPISPTSVTYRSFAVHAMQSGWISQNMSVANGTVLLNPIAPFHPGELVQVSATTATVNLSGEGPITPTVWQFWAGVEGGTAAYYDSGQQLGLDDNRGLALGDLDGDGDLDAFVGDIDGPNQVYFNDGTGLFTDSGQALGGINTLGIALGDLDGDGDLDVFESLLGGAPNHIWFNNGNGMFTDSGQNLGNSNSFWTALGDLDGDGDLDAFVPNGNQIGGIPQPNKVYFNDGSGMFIDSGQNLGNSLSTGVSLGDLDDDGDLDAFIANGGYWPDANKVWINDGTGFFTDTGQLLGNGESLLSALGDLDNDGDLDAFVTNSNEPAGGESDEVWFNDGDGNFTFHQAVGKSASFGLALADIDHDGDLDAAIGGDGGGGIWLNDGLGMFTQTGQVISIGIAYLGDLDSDGDLDIFNARLNNIPNEVWFNEDPILELAATSNSPTSLGDSTTLTATVASGTNINYSWDFGDDNMGMGQVVSHTYADAGTYTATVTAVNPASTVTATTIVLVVEPISGLMATNDSPTELGLATTLTATITAGTNVDYSWDFGDGHVGVGQVVTHIYTSTGTYTATVTATNTAGSMMATMPVTVYKATFNIYLPAILKPEL